MQMTSSQQTLSPMAPEASVGYGWIAPLANIALERGIDVSHILYCLGIEPHQLRHTAARLTPRQAREFWRLSVAHLGDKLVGLQVGEHMDLKLFPGIGTAVAHASDLGHAIELMSELASCISTDLEIVSELQYGRWLVRIRSTAQPTALCYERFAMIACIMKLARTQTVFPVVPREVHFRGTLHSDPVAISEHLRVPLMTDKDDDVLVFDQADQYVSFKHANQETSVFGECVARYFLSRLPLPATFCEQIRQKIILVMERTDAKLSVVAQESGISLRTLQRRLDMESCSYASLLEEVKRHFLTQLLLKTDAPISRISNLLHFSEPSSLTRACVRWFGVSPMNYRKQLRREAA